jgi:hypothetical protein
MTLKKPFHVISDGRVKATIWHEIQNGKTKFNVAFTRLFTDSDRWWDGACFQPDDMPAISRLADDVDLWISLQARRLSPVNGGDEGEGTS